MGIPEDVALLDHRLAELIIKYENYFLGLEKREPLKQLDEVERLARKYTTGNIANTMVAFKYNSLKSRLVSYKQHWNRITRLMEEGKYSRDRFKMEYHEKAQPEKQRSAASLPVPLTTEPAQKSSESEDLYRQLIDARRACNLSTENVTVATVANLVEKHKRQAMEKYQCKEVDLSVTIENGSPKLKIRPKS